MAFKDKLLIVHLTVFILSLESSKITSIAGESLS